MGYDAFGKRLHLTIPPGQRATCMWEEIHEGRLSPQFREMTRQHTFKFCDKTLGAAKMLSALILGCGGKSPRPPAPPPPASARWRGPQARGLGFWG